MTEPLAGRRILVTRALHQVGKLSDGLRALGAEPVEVPVLEIRPPESFAALDAALRGFNAYDWIIFTSANAVRALVERSASLGISFRSASQPQVAAIGEATASAARNAGFTVGLVPGSYVAESLVESLADHARGKRILLARAETARDLIPDALRKAGAQVDVIDAYRNVLPESAPGLLRLKQRHRFGIEADKLLSPKPISLIGNRTVGEVAALFKKFQSGLDCCPVCDNILAIDQITNSARHFRSGFPIQMPQNPDKFTKYRRGDHDHFGALKFLPRQTRLSRVVLKHIAQQNIRIRGDLHRLPAHASSVNFLIWAMVYRGVPFFAR